MSSVSAILAAIAATAFCVMHAILAVIAERKEGRRIQEIARIRKELDDEIRNGGNLARVAALRGRLLELEAE